MKTSITLALLILSPLVAEVALSPASHASEDSYIGAEDFGVIPESDSEGPAEDQELLAPTLSAPLAPREAFLRTQSVLRHLGLPEEADSQALVAPLAGHQTWAGIQALLKVLDPTGMFQRYLGGQGGDELIAFQDNGSLETPDFSVSVAKGAPSSQGLAFHEHLLAAKNNPPALPLRGLRIAIDPGHMGGEFWDKETGKHVHDGHGHSLSEGVLNLQVALLLEKAFTGLGAHVMLTHRGLTPVDPEDFLKKPIRPLGLRQIRNSTLSTWFQNLLAAGPADSPALFAAVDKSPKIATMLADNRVNRDEYFIRGDDLIARSNAIEAFDADIALVIHFDVSTPAGDPGGLNHGPRDGTKVYVVGDFASAEVSSREDRSLLARHLLDATSWDASLNLGRNVVGHLHDELKVPFSNGGGGFSTQFEPGIFARNLVVSRRVTERALTYIECLFYNDPSEFAALSNAQHPMQISGEDHPYSDRMVQVAQAIKNGVLGFVKGYAAK